MAQLYEISTASLGLVRLDTVKVSFDSVGGRRSGGEMKRWSISSF